MCLDSPLEKLSQVGLGVELLLLNIERSYLRWLVRMCPKASLLRCSEHIQLGGGPEEDTGHVDGTMFLGVPGNALGFL